MTLAVAPSGAEGSQHDMTFDFRLSAARGSLRLAGRSAGDDMIALTEFN